MNKRALAALIACLAIAAGAAGCGGGGDSTSSGGDTATSDSTEASGSAPTKAVFVKEADAVCLKADSKLNEEVADYAKEKGIPTNKEPTEDQQVELYEAVVIPNVKTQGEGIAELTPPEGEEDAVAEIVDALEAGVEDAEGDPQQLVEGKNPLADASSKASAYGMKVCGSE